MAFTTFDPLIVLRILCGIWFIPHCIGKMQNFVAASATFAKINLRPGAVFVAITITLELFAGIGLVFGILETYAAMLAIVVLVGASYAVIRLNGFNWRWQKHGPEYMLFWAIACGLSVSGGV